MDISAEREANLKLYPNRKHAYLSAGLLLICSICTFAVDISLIIGLLHNDIKSGFILYLILCFIITFIFVTLSGLMLRSVFRPSYWQTPTVTIDRQGITCRYWFGRQRILVPWEEIASLSSGVLGSTFTLKNPFLAVTLKDAERFKALYASNSRRNFKRNATTGVHFVVYQSWATQPIPEILHTIHETYGEELREHGVQML